MREYAVPPYVTGAEIRDVRKKLNLTQKEFALLIGSSKPTIERWEASGDPVKGPIALLIKMLREYPENFEHLALPEKRYPLRLKYMCDQNLCTVIDVNDLEQKVRVTNYVQNVMFRAFGINEHPGYEEYLQFLESRCFPRSRDKMKLQLEQLGLPFYDPMMIIEKTQGRVEGDPFWIEVERD